jgi:hypothetical protein
VPSSLYLRTKRAPVTKTLCFIETSDDGQSPKTYFFHIQNKHVILLISIHIKCYSVGFLEK